MRLPLVPLLLLPFIVATTASSLHAEAAKPAVEVVKPTAEAVSTGDPVQDLLNEQKAWQFAPPPGRKDVFLDLEEVYKAKKADESKVDPNPSGKRGVVPGQDLAATIEWAKLEVPRVVAFLEKEQWDEAMKVCDNASRMLAPFVKTGKDQEVIRLTELLKRYFDQAAQGKLHDEAEAKFKALGLKVEGILWSENSPSMVIMAGESKALTLNSRIKDCVIINIHRSSVDFLFHYNRQRFEFQCYLEGDAASGGASGSSSGKNR